MKEQNFPSLVKSLYVLHAVLVAFAVCALIGRSDGFISNMFEATLEGIGWGMGILCFGQGFLSSKWGLNGTSTKTVEKLEIRNDGATSASSVTTDIPNPSPETASNH